MSIMHSFKFVVTIITNDNQVHTKFTLKKLSIQVFTEMFDSQSICDHPTAKMFTLYPAAK